MFEVCPICHFDSVICTPRAGRLYAFCTMCYASREIPLPDPPEDPPESDSGSDSGSELESDPESDVYIF